MLCVHASCPPAASSLLRLGGPLHVLLPGLDTHPSTPCSTTACAYPLSCPISSSSQPWAKPRCPIPPPDTLAFHLCSSSRGAPEGLGSRPYLTDPYPSGYLLTVSGRNQGG